MNLYVHTFKQVRKIILLKLIISGILSDIKHVDGGKTS